VGFYFFLKKYQKEFFMDVLQTYGKGNSLEKRHGLPPPAVYGTRKEVPFSFKEKENLFRCCFLLF